MQNLPVSDLIQIVPAAARLEALEGETAHRIRAGVIELLAESCDADTMLSARQQLLQRVGLPLARRDAELKLLDEALELLGMRADVDTRAGHRIAAGF